MALIERVEPRVQPVAQDDRPPADRLGDGGVLALGVARHVHAATEREGAGVEALGERGLARSDDAGEHDVRGGDDAALIQHPRVVDEAAARVEVLPDEHPGRAEAGFGQERILPGQRRGRVLMPRQPEPARRAQRPRPRLARRGQVDRGALLGLLGVPPRLRFGLLRRPRVRLDSRRGPATRLAVPASLTVRADEYARVQTALTVAGHSASPRPGADAAPGGRANQSVAAPCRAGRAGGLGRGVGVSISRSAGSGRASCSRSKETWPRNGL